MSPLGIVVLIVLVDLLGFSIVMPLLAPFARHYGFSEWQIGLLFSAYPLCQLVAGPILGRLSDRYGRRPILILSQAGTAASFLILGLSRQYWIMLLARMLDGASGGNILVAQAYVADVTKPEHRARGMGLIGMAFGLGFVLGPLMAGLLLSLPVGGGPAAAAAVPGGRGVLDGGLGAGAGAAARVAAARRRGPAVGAGAEPPGARRHRPAAGSRPAGAGRVPGHPGVRGVRGDVRPDARPAVRLGPAAGVVRVRGDRAAERGRAGRPDPPPGPALGEPRLIVAGIALAAAGFAGLAISTGVAGLAASMLLLGTGQGVLGPSVSGLLSRRTPDREQGAVFGTFSSAQTLARMISYSASNILLGRVSTAAPYWAGFGVDLLALAAAVPVAVGAGVTAGADADADADAVGSDVPSDELGRSRSR